MITREQGTLPAQGMAAWIRKRSQDSMKALPSLFFLACFASAALADSPVIPLPTRTVLLGGPNNQFKVTLEPDTGSAPAAPKPADEPIVRMKPFLVTADAEYRALAAIFQQQERAIKEKKFSWRNGGVLFERKGKVFTSTLRIQFIPNRHGADLIRFSLSW